MTLTPLTRKLKKKKYVVESVCAMERTPEKVFLYIQKKWPLNSRRKNQFTVIRDFERVLKKLIFVANYVVTWKNDDMCGKAASAHNFSL